MEKSFFKHITKDLHTHLRLQCPLVTQVSDLKGAISRDKIPVFQKKNLIKPSI